MENEIPPRTVQLSESKKLRTSIPHGSVFPRDYEHETQLENIKNLLENPDTGSQNPTAKIMMQQIQQKINGYRSQDIQKSLYNESEFVDLHYVLQLLTDAENFCYYCKKPVYILYEIVREPKQWTLERLDNKLGHNRGNVKIACLDCNLRRKTMYHERFAFTKQFNVVKKN
jgi:hypothetical protein